MNTQPTRRGFLRFLGLGAAAAVTAPIIKPKAFFSFYTGKVYAPEVYRPYAAGYTVDCYDWIDLDRLVAEIGGNLGIAPEVIARTKPFTDSLNRRSLTT